MSFGVSVACFDAANAAADGAMQHTTHRLARLRQPLSRLSALPLRHCLAASAAGQPRLQRVLPARCLATQRDADEPKSRGKGKGRGKAKGGDDLASTWQWMPPTREEHEDPIPVKPREWLTIEEIKFALETEGGLDIDVVELKEPMDTITHLVFVTGHTGRHLRRMADILVRALKHRELTEAPGIEGAEGYEDDDWMCVDCYNILVHLMQQRTRQALALEQHWRADKRLEAPVTNDEAQFERLMDEIVAANPTPPEYQAVQEEEDEELRKYKPVKTL